MTDTDSDSLVASPVKPGAKWLRRGFLLAIVLGCAVAISPSPADPDLWGHVQYGRDVLTDGQIHATTTYSYTANGYRWINHENLAELLLAVGADTIGPTGLLLAKCLLGVFVILMIMSRAARQGAGLITMCAVALLVATNLAFHWAVRPQLLSYFYFTLMIALLTWCFRGWEGGWHLRLPRRKSDDDAAADSLSYSSRRMRCLWLMPILLMFWANSHGGFVAGVCIYLAYLTFRTVEVLSVRGRAGFGLARRFVLMMAAGVLATLVNPYGPGLHLWLVESLGVPRPEITEWHPPKLLTIGALQLWLIIGLFVSSMIFSRKSRDFTHLMLLGITLWQSLEHLRHLPFFAILFGFWMPAHVESLWRRLRSPQDDTELRASMTPRLRWVLAGGLCLTFALLGYRLYDRLSELRVEKAHYPVSAFQFMADHELNGKLIVTYNWAQYAIATFGSDSPDDGIVVSFDGRFRTCYPREVVDMNFDFVLGDGGPDQRHRSPKSGPFDPTRVLKVGNPDLVLISRGQPHSVRIMEENDEQWVLLYQDYLAQLWGRRSKFDDPASPHFVRPGDRIVSDERQTGTVTWPAYPVRGRKTYRIVNDSPRQPADSDS